MIGKIQPDMIGQKFERLLVLSYDKEMSKQRGYDCYLCRCNCGVEKLIRGYHLRNRVIQSCGCLSREVGKNQFNKISQKFGRLLVLSYDKEISEQKRHEYYLCRCDCGVKTLISGNKLRRRQWRGPSCGCLNLNQIGENHPAYIHGFDAGLRRFRKIVHERDKVCRLCGMTKKDHLSKYSKNLECHHLDGDNINNDPKNGALLCKPCHGIMRLNDNVWRPA